MRADVAARMQATHPADSSLGRASEALAERDFRVEVNAGGPLTSATLAAADVLVIAHPSEPQWESTVGEGSPVLTEAEIEALAAWVEGGGGLIVLGETEQAKYGNNLNELLARFGVEIENCTVQDYEHHREAPTWIYADLVDAEVAGADPLARVREACFYRAGTLALANGARAIARTSATAAPPEAPLAAVVEHGAGRVVVLSDSDLFGDDCIGALDHEALWVNLAYWAAAPSFGRPAERPASEAAADPAWISLRDAVEELRAHQEADGSVAAEGRDDARLRELTAGDRRRCEGARAAVPAPGRLHRGAGSGPGGLGRRRLRQARLHPLGRGLPAGARAPRRHRAPRRLPDVQAERTARDLLRGVDRPRSVARVGGGARAGVRQRQVRAGGARRLHDRLRLRVRGALPRDLRDRGASAEPLRRDLLRPRGRALPADLRLRGRDPAAEPPARRRVPAGLGGPLPGRVHRLGPDPRPHPHARRSSLRPLHDPPAEPVLDVLARGAPLRPDRVR